MPDKLSLATYADRPKISKTNAAKAMEHPNTWKKKKKKKFRFDSILFSRGNSFAYEKVPN